MEIALLFIKQQTYTLILPLEFPSAAILLITHCAHRDTKIRVIENPSKIDDVLQIKSVFFFVEDPDCRPQGSCYRVSLLLLLLEFTISGESERTGIRSTSDITDGV